MRDPFIVHTPEQLSAQEIAQYFVETYTDFPRLQEPVNMFVHGARGAGKSIMLKSLEFAVQELLDKPDGLPYFAIHIPIKPVFFGNHEFRRVSGWKGTTVGEHLLSVHCMQYILHTSGQFFQRVAPQQVKQEFIQCWEDCGGEPEDRARLEACNSLEELAKFCDRETRKVRQYYVRLPDDQEPEIYGGALTGFRDFVLPVIESLQNCGERHIAKPFGLMVDDADNLPVSLQKVLNSWISTRTVKTACFKITTQLGYKTFRTVDNRIIESPHDFSEINISGLYTSSRNNFHKKIKEIVSRRLNIAEINVTPEKFFPPNEKQLTRLKEIEAALKAGDRDPYVQLKGSGPKQDRDWAQRYANPSLFRELNNSRSSHTYSYAGLQSMIDLSSGVVRWFLEPAGKMYVEAQNALDAGNNTMGVTNIPVGLQDKVISAWSKDFRGFLDTTSVSAEDIGEESSLHAHDHDPESYRKLGNLLDAIGQFCRKRLLNSTESEQRLFSFVLNDDPSERLQSVLHLGVRLGYLQKTDLASKTSMGVRRPRYILSRRLGPHYKLDVSGFAAHLSVTCGDLEIAMHDPDQFVKLRAKELVDDNQKSIDFGG